MGKVPNGFGSTFVQQATLEKLKCIKCKKYLSIFPIFKNTQGDAICGRCKVDNTVGFSRDELYERAIEFQRFPCTNRERGCLEVLFPASLAEHEKRCLYMKHECPTKMYNNCTWLGSLSELVEHFEKKHPTFILKEGRFEVDFIHSHNENYIMPYGEEWYVVTREAKPDQGIFSIVVNYLGSDIKYDEYIYDISLESGNKAYKYSFQQHIGGRLDIEENFISQMLHEPITIIASINIKEGQNALIGTDSEENNDLDYEQLRNVECIVCMEYMIPPIYQCETGHSICHSCKEHQKNCPECRAPFGNTRNFLVENFILKMTYPCKHSGCKYKAIAKDIRQHEATCIFGPFICPLREYEKCSSVFPLSQLFDHIKNNHYESLLELDTISVPFDESIDENINEGYILKHTNLLFKICFKYDFAEKIFLWSVQLIGPQEESTKYNYELEVIDNNAKGMRMYIKTNCISLVDENETFQSLNNYIYLHYDQICKLIKNQLIYRIIITRKL